MTLPDLHPDDLLRRASHDQITQAERADLAAHFRRCPACALELAASADAARAGVPSEADHAIAARVVERVLASTTAPGGATCGPALERTALARRAHRAHVHEHRGRRIRDCGPAARTRPGPRPCDAERRKRGRAGPRAASATRRRRSPAGPATHGGRRHGPARRCRGAGSDRAHAGAREPTAPVLRLLLLLKRARGRKRSPRPPGRPGLCNRHPSLRRHPAWTARTRRSRSRAPRRRGLGGGSTMPRAFMTTSPGAFRAAGKRLSPAFCTDSCCWQRCAIRRRR